MPCHDGCARSQSRNQQNQSQSKRQQNHGATILISSDFRNIMKMIKLAHIGIICLMLLATFTSAGIVITEINNPDLYSCESMLRQTKDLCISDQLACIEDDLVLLVCNDLNMNRALDWKYDLIKSGLLFSAWITTLAICIIYLKKTVAKCRWILVLIFLGVFVVLFLVEYWVLMGTGRGKIETSGIDGVEYETYDYIRRLIEYFSNIPLAKPN